MSDYQKLKEEEISKNPITLSRYERDLNNILKFIDEKVNTLSDSEIEEAKTILKGLRHKFVNCFSRLGVKIVLDQLLLKPVTEENILFRPYPISSLRSTVHSESAILKISDDSNSESDEEFFEPEAKALGDIDKSLSLLEKTLNEVKEEDHDTDDTNTTNITDENNSKMDAATVVGSIAKLLPHNFSGNPLELDAFLKSISLIQTVVGQSQPNIVFNFIKSKLIGKALECIPADATTIQHITTLRTK